MSLIGLYTIKGRFPFKLLCLHADELVCAKDMVEIKKSDKTIVISYMDSTCIIGRGGYRISERGGGGPGN